MATRALLLLLLVSCGSQPAETSPAPPAEAPEEAPALAPAQAEDGLSVRSPGFEEGGRIPRKYTCQGEDVPPPLRFSGIPDGTRSLALIVDDPDAPGGTWVHWVVYEIPPETESLPEGGPLPPGAQQGTNSWDNASWGGPCPPAGEHRYRFQLYALDTQLQGLEQPTKEELVAAMEGHVQAAHTLVGVYSKE